jgi:hypothetical protein
MSIREYSLTQPLDGVSDVLMNFFSDPPQLEAARSVIGISPLVGSQSKTSQKQF